MPLKGLFDMMGESDRLDENPSSTRISSFAHATLLTPDANKTAINT
jgi:hypothetical protein